MAKKILKALKRLYTSLFKLKCPDCNGIMDLEMIDMQFDTNVYKCRKCGKGGFEMPRYIDANAIEHDLVRACGAYASDILKNAPTIEAGAVKHGKWIFAGDGIIMCTCCKEAYCSAPIFPRNYCPNCGAKMDGDEA